MFLCKELRALTEVKTHGLRQVKTVAAEIEENPSTSVKVSCNFDKLRMCWQDFQLHIAKM